MPVIGNLIVNYIASTLGFERGTRKVQAGLSAVQLSALRTGASLAAMAGGALFLKLVRDGEMFSRKMRNSLAIMEKQSVETQQRMSAAAFKVAADTKASASEAAEAYFFLASAGLKAEEAIAALPVVGAFAQAGMFDLSLATDLLTDAQSALGLTIKGDALKNMENMIFVGDNLVKANTQANASVQQFSESLTTKAAPAMRILNIELEEGLAVLAVFADQGVKGAEAGTAFQIVLRELTLKAILNKKAFKEAGIEVFDATGKFNNLADIVEQLEKRMEGASDETQKMRLSMLGFTNKSIAFVQSLIGMSDKIRTFEEGQRSAGGTMQDVADNQLTAMQKGMEELGAESTKLGNLLSEELTPSIVKASNALTQFTRLFEFSPATLSVVTSLVKAFTPIIGVLEVAADFAALFNDKILITEEQAKKTASAIQSLTIAQRDLSAQESALQLQEGGLGSVEGMLGAGGGAGPLAASVVETVEAIARLDKELEAAKKSANELFQSGEFFSETFFRNSEEGLEAFDKIGGILGNIVIHQNNLAKSTEGVFAFASVANDEFGSWEAAVRAANAAIKSILTPAEKLEAAEKRINALLNSGLITMEQQVKLLEKAEEDLFGKPSTAAADMIRKMTDDLRVLRGEITESELALAKLGATDVETSRLRFLDREINKERAAQRAELRGDFFSGARKNRLAGGIRGRAGFQSAGAAVEKGSLGAFSAIAATLKRDPKDRQAEIAKNTKNQNIKQDTTNRLLEKQENVRVNWHR